MNCGKWKFLLSMKHMVPKTSLLDVKCTFQTKVYEVVLLKTGMGTWNIFRASEIHSNSFMVMISVRNTLI